MTDGHSLDNAVLGRDRSNPYAVDGPVALSTDRTIEKLEPSSLAVGEHPVAVRRFSAEEIAPMRSVKAGLQYYYSGIYLVAFCFLVGGFLGRIIGPNAGTLIAYGTTLGILIVLIGEIRCLAIPRAAGGFQFVLVSVFFYSLGVGLHLLKSALQGQGNVPAALLVQIGMLQLLFGFLANFFFLTFIISLTRYLENKQLFQSAIQIRRAIWSMFGFVSIVLFVFAILVNRLPRNGQQLAFVVLAIGILGFVILVYSWLNRFTRLVQETCSSIILETDPIETEPGALDS